MENIRTFKRKLRVATILLKGIVLSFPLPTMASLSFLPGKLLFLQVTDCLLCKVFLNPPRILVPSSSVRSRCYVFMCIQMYKCTQARRYICTHAGMYICMCVFYSSPASFIWAWKLYLYIRFPVFVTTSGTLESLN